MKDIPYFVTHNFLRTIYRDRYQLGQVERMVQDAYENYLVNECTNQRKFKEHLERDARRKPIAEERDKLLKQAAEYELTRCTELVDLFPHEYARYK